MYLHSTRWLHKDRSETTTSDCGKENWEDGWERDLPFIPFPFSLNVSTCASITFIRINYGFKIPVKEIELGVTVNGEV
jgi:hypothetical protein